jgi:hypothetical protein
VARLWDVYPSASRLAIVAMVRWYTSARFHSLITA